MVEQIRKYKICSEDETSKQGGDKIVTVEFDTQNESEKVLLVNTDGDDAEPSSSVENNAENSSVGDDYSVFHSYRELSDVVTAYEIETISKYNKGFDVDINLENYLSTVRKISICFGVIVIMMIPPTSNSTVLHLYF